MKNGQTNTRTPDLIAIGKAYGAGRNSDDENAIREAEDVGRRIVDQAKDRTRKDICGKQIRPCVSCGTPFNTQKCYVCGIDKKAASGWQVKVVPWWAVADEKLEAAGIADRDASAARRQKDVDKAKEWVKLNLEILRIHNQNTAARKRQNGGILSKGLLAKLFKLQRGKCACCNQPLGENFHLDHIMPTAMGGANVDNNIQLLRQRCNNQKHAKDPITFMQSRGFLL